MKKTLQLNSLLDQYKTLLPEDQFLSFESEVDRLRELSQRTRLDETWKSGYSASNRCVFLGADNACRNYENRPTVCRKHSVISPVSECEKVDGNPVPKLMPLAEIVMSAAVHQPGNDYGSLAKMLQSVLDERAALIRNAFPEKSEIQEDLL